MLRTSLLRRAQAPTAMLCRRISLQPLHRRTMSSVPPPPPSSPNKAASTGSIIEITAAADFEPLVMAASAEPPPVGGPVIIDFYADWCEPCKQLTPALEKLVVAAQGAVRLAKVNVDNLPELASALQVKELPTVMVVHKGKLVESFMGGLPEAKLKEFVDRAVALAGGPASGKRALEEAAVLLDEGKLGEATQAYADLTALPEHAASATAGLAMCALADDNLAMANEMVTVLQKKHAAELGAADVRKAISRVALAQQDEGSGASVEELHAQLEEEPLRHAARLELAQLLMQRDEGEAAVNELLLIIRKTVRKKDDAEAAQAAADAKAYLFKVFDAMGTDDPLAKASRRRLANILLV